MLAHATRSWLTRLGDRAVDMGSSIPVVLNLSWNVGHGTTNAWLSGLIDMWLQRNGLTDGEILAVSVKGQDGKYGALDRE